MLNGSTPTIASIYKLNNLTEDLLKLPQFYPYGRQPLYPVFDMITENIKTICEVYRKFPDTLINLLEQTCDKETLESYQDRLEEIQATRTQEQQIILNPLLMSLEFLKTVMHNQDTYITEAFHREINMLKNPENKSALFKAIIKDACQEAINITVINIRNYHMEQTASNELKRLAIS